MKTHLHMPRCLLGFCYRSFAQQTGVPTSILGEGQGCQLPQIDGFSTIQLDNL